MSSVFLCKCCCAPVIFLLSWCPKNPARKVSFLFVRHVLSTHFSIWPSGLGFFSSVWVVTFDIACTSSQDIFNSSSSNRLPILQRSANLLSRLFDSYLFFWWSRIVKASRTSRYGFSQAHCCHQFLSHCKFFFSQEEGNWSYTPFMAMTMRQCWQMFARTQLRRKYNELQALVSFHRGGTGCGNLAGKTSAWNWYSFLNDEPLPWGNLWHQWWRTNSRHV